MRLAVAEDGVLHWPGRVLSALELDRLRCEVRHVRLAPGTVVTPSAREWLRDRGVGVNVDAEPPAMSSGWRLAQERPFPLVQSAVESLHRESVTFEPWSERGSTPMADWLRWLTEEMEATSFRGAVVFCTDAALACCVANKRPSIRAAAVVSVAQTERALNRLGANWLAIEMPGRSFFEIRQMLRLTANSRAECPLDLAEVLQAMSSGG